MTADLTTMTAAVRKLASCFQLAPFPYAHKEWNEAVAVLDSFLKPTPPAYDPASVNNYPYRNIDCPKCYPKQDAPETREGHKTVLRSQHTMEVSVYLIQGNAGEIRAFVGDGLNKDYWKIIGGPTRITLTAGEVE